MKTILLKFAGPMQSWGTSSRFETRYTDRYPSKSAVIGMIAASLGYRRDDDNKMNRLNSLDFAVRIDQPGSLLRDYHIATKYKNKGIVDRTYVTQRYYLQDAIFVVAIGSNALSLMKEIEDALKAPYFQPCLGRRSLPLNADFYLKNTEKGVIESLRDQEWAAAGWFKAKTKKKEVDLEVYADSDLAGTPRQIMPRDLPSTFSQEGRQFRFRPVSKITVKIALEHDAFGAIGGENVHIKS